MRTVQILTSVMLVLALASCNTQENPQLSGSLLIIVTGLPDTVDANVTIAGPSGFEQTLGATQTLAPVPAGTYVVHAASVSDQHPIAPTLYDPTINDVSIEVTPRTSSGTVVAYGVRPVTGTMLIGIGMESTDIARGFRSGRLIAAEAPDAFITITGASEDRDQYGGIAFDADGNAWIAGYFSGELLRYSATVLAAATGAAAPDITITGISRPIGLAFDDDAALWVTTDTHLHKYEPLQLIQSGEPTPSVTIASTGGTTDSLDYPRGLAFDTSGNLWIANLFGSLVRFTPDQLQASGSPEPSRIITVDALLLDVAFDTTGALWMTTATGATVLRLDADDLSSSGQPTPAATISGFPAMTRGLAIDHSGALWVTSGTSTNPQLISINNPTSYTGNSPAVFNEQHIFSVSGELLFPAIFPAPPGLGIRTP